MATSKVTDEHSAEFINAVETSSEEGILMKAKELVWQLGHLQIPQETMDSLLIQQFSLAKSRQDLKWIKAVRKEATVIYSDRWIDTHLPLPGGKKKQAPKSGRSSSSSSSSQPTGSHGLCRDVRLSMGEDLPVQHELCGDASANPTPLEDQQAMDCSPSLDIVPVVTESVLSQSVSKETVLFSAPSLAVSLPPPSTVVHTCLTDGTTVTTSEHIIMVETPAEEPSTVVSLKRKSNPETSPSPHPPHKVKVQRCPFPECSAINTRLKKHIYKAHLPNCFSEERISLQNNLMCVHALDSLSRAVLGRVDYDRLLEIVQSPGAIPEPSTLHPHLVEKMKSFCTHKSWPIPEQFSLHPANSRALLLHFRCLCCLLLRLSEEQRNEFLALSQGKGASSTVPVSSSRMAVSSSLGPSPSSYQVVTSQGKRRISQGKSASSTVPVSSSRMAVSSSLGPSPSSYQVVTSQGKRRISQGKSASSTVPVSSSRMAVSSSLESSPSSYQVVASQGKRRISQGKCASSTVPLSSSRTAASSSLESSPSSYQVVASQGKRRIEKVEHSSVPAVLSYASAVKTNLPRAFDSHFHFDRSCFKIWGTTEGKVPEDLIRFGQAECLPAHPVQLIGGVAVFSEPSNYDLIPSQPQKWYLAVGVHPKHVEELTDQRFSQFQSLLKRPAVHALGEVGLDRTVPAAVWRRQEAILDKVLGCATPNQCLVLHLRGSRDDKYGIDVHARCLRILDRTVARRQKIHLHSFTGDAGLVSEWREMYPNTYFGISGLARSFDARQIEALKTIPMDRLLLETDSPYLSVNNPINSPACIGDIANLVASKMGKPLEEILSRSVENGVRLYQ
uniref:Flocculation protein FLO11-like n=1 Tax=Crassostrea virginica TaxID=6565 RepID=A0A8B8BWF1_CRAVI|nr:flocculation protein FLO11-like [Crassostrea virginica]